MKKTVLALVVAAATGVALSAQAPAQPSSSAPAKQTAKTKTTTASKEASTSMKAKSKAKVELAEVVSTDAAAKSITVKPASGENQTYTATGAAVAELAKVKAGDQVKLTLHDSDVTKISMATSKSAHAHSGAKKSPMKKESTTK